MSRLGIGISVGLLLLSGLAATGAHADTGPPCSVAWGAYADGAPASFDAITDLETKMGRPAVIIHWSQGWQPDSNPELDSQQLQAVRDHGAWPFISWQPEGVPLSDIVSGGWDELIDRWATRMADYGDPVLLAPLAEMDDARHSYAWNAAGNSEDLVVAAWRHIHDRFATAGANNVLWVFDVAGQADTPLVRLYPGDQEVDWLGLEAYNWSSVADRPWTSLADLISPVYAQLEATSKDKPVLLAEFGSVEAGGDKPQWLRDGGQAIPATFSQIKAVVAFDSVDPRQPAADWRLDTTAASEAAARDAFGPGTAYCLTAADLTGGASDQGGPIGRLRRSLSLGIPLLALTILFAVGIGASKLPRPHLGE